MPGNAAGHIEVSGAAGNEEAKKNLRDQLRRTLSQKPEQSGKMESSWPRAFSAVYTLSLTRTFGVTKRDTSGQANGRAKQLTLQSSSPQVRVPAWPYTHVHLLTCT